MPKVDNVYLNPQDIAARLQINVSAVYRLLKNKKVKGRQVAGRWRVTERELERYLTAKTVVVTAGRLKYGVTPDGEIQWFQVK